MGGFDMLAQVYLNWNGTTEEFNQVKTIVRDIVANTDGVELEGLYIPSNEWNYSVLYKFDSFEKFILYQKNVRIQLKNRKLAKIPDRKLELFIRESELE